jgi:hypothetical protein
MKKIDKLIVTNKSALKNKYDKDTSQVISILKSLVYADKQKGLNSILVFMDDAVQMKSLNVNVAVTSPINQRLNKNAIDLLYQRCSPDYMMIFGATDIVPQIELLNPLYQPNDDTDKHVKSDLPYACDAAFSKDIGNFLSPTRVVGRLPDIHGVNDLKYVKKIIDTVNRFKSQPAQTYKSYFAVSAHVWLASTQMSVKNIFESNNRLQEVPAAGPNWSGQQLSAMSHFVNCHGSPQDSNWYGQKRNNYPVSVSAAQIDGKIMVGTIAAAECCYGAQLFDPGTMDSVKPICNTYFANGAVAFLGSSTIAYGPASGNEQADLITQSFLSNIIWSGASSGRALLEARQKYILNHGPDLSPTDLKTIAQFNLLGDPSVHPVEMASTTTVKGKSKDFMKEFYAENGRSERRKYLVSKGNSLKTFANKIVRDKKIKVNANSKKEIHEILKQLNVKTRDGISFKVRQNAVNRKTFNKSPEANARYHVFSEMKENNPFSHTLTSFKELGGKVVNVKHYVRK